MAGACEWSSLAQRVWPARLAEVVPERHLEGEEAARRFLVLFVVWPLGREGLGRARAGPMHKAVVKDARHVPAAEPHRTLKTVGELWNDGLFTVRSPQELPQRSAALRSGE